jgi:hypothetical protein
MINITQSIQEIRRFIAGSLAVDTMGLQLPEPGNISAACPTCCTLELEGHTECDIDIDALA